MSEAAPKIIVPRERLASCARYFAQVFGKGPPAIRLVRILRWCPHSFSFDRHLDDCAALWLFGCLGEPLPPLKLRHVIGFESLPPLYPEAAQQ